MRNCISCGMPLTKPEDFPLKDETLHYCVHCANVKGELRPYGEVLENYAKFLNQEQNIPLYDARKKAEAYLAKMPQWKKKQPLNVKLK